MHDAVRLLSPACSVSRVATEPNATFTRHVPHAMPRAGALAAEAVSFEAGGRLLVDRATFTLNPDSLTVVMGANGAGKSLLLRMLHGLVTPTAGTVLLADRPLDEAARRQQAMVFQRPVLLRRSVAANIDFVLGLRGQLSASRRDGLLERVGLLDRGGQPARLLSGGEQQRLALARALASDPLILFLDEPTANLDPASTMLIERIVREVHEQGTKIIFVTHDIGQARRLADDVLFMHAGRVVESADAKPFFASPGSAAARAYLDGRIFV